MKNSANRFTQNSSLNYALNILSRRNITASKLRKKMAEKGFPEEEIIGTINKLVEWKYLDDYSYAVAYVKAKSQKCSRNKILGELMNHGVAKELIIDVLESFYSEEKEFANCLDLATKIWNNEGVRWNEKFQKKFKNKCVSRKIFFEKKLADKLLTKGFPPNIIKSVLSIVLVEEDY